MRSIKTEVSFNAVSVNKLTATAAIAQYGETGVELLKDKAGEVTATKRKPIGVEYQIPEITEIMQSENGLRFVDDLIQDAFFSFVRNQVKNGEEYPTQITVALLQQAAINSKSDGIDPELLEAALESFQSYCIARFGENQLASIKNLLSYAKAKFVLSRVKDLDEKRLTGMASVVGGYVEKLQPDELAVLSPVLTAWSNNLTKAISTNAESSLDHILDNV